ncbi:radical SAM superfamily protein [Escherichia coli]|uniref:Radical SAM superfamily protein n=1 Tax=Escherichia coli TaxID=562 RepID=A0A377AUH9_ECOLX|nr:radical SAM superfamily protein [Escherichia coli]
MPKIRATSVTGRLLLSMLLAHPELDEMIFSGGDPLMAKDHELDWLLTTTGSHPAYQTSADSQPSADCDPGTYHRGAG